MASSFGDTLAYDHFWTSPFSFGENFLSFDSFDPSILNNVDTWPNNLFIQPSASPLSFFSQELSSPQSIKKEWTVMNPATSSPEQDTVDSNKNNTNIREQKLRFPGDAYTPRWVRHRGREKEGLCELCPTPKWFQLKNSAFWYHKQFVHGISSVSGMPFWQPTEKRWNEHPSGKRLFEGLCPQCQQWIPLISPHKRHPHRWVAWYRHAYKCHDYLKMT